MARKDTLPLRLLVIIFVLMFIIIGSMILSTYPSVMTFFVENKKAITLIHVVSMALGLGGATFSDYFFFKFLKDFKISRFEKSVLDSLSNVIWIMLFVAMASGAALFLPEIDRFMNSSKFLLKLIVVSVITLNGIALNILIAPSLMKFSFRKDSHPTHKTVHLTRRLGFALGAVSILSWYTAFFLGSFRSLPWSFETLLIGYILLLIVGIAGSQLVDAWFCHKQKVCKVRNTKKLKK